MKDSMKQHTFHKLAATTIAVFSVFGLGACGGGGGGDDAAGSAAAQPSAAAATASTKVEGHATPLSSEFETVKVVLPPVTWSADGSLPSGKVRFGGVQPASALRAHAPGAYTALPWDGEVLSLSQGTVTDIAGNGHFAIGRWTAGSDSAGYAYNVNQGRVWALGAPLSERVNLGAGMHCALTAATRPTASDGNTAPGNLTSAAAVVTDEMDAFGQIGNVASLDLRYSIGSDRDQSFTSDVRVGAMALSRSLRSSVATTFFGPDASKPYLAVSYGVHAPTVGLINGIAVLQCSRLAPQEAEEPATPAPQQAEEPAIPAPQEAEEPAIPVPQQAEEPAIPAPQQAEESAIPAPQQAEESAIPAPQEAEEPAIDRSGIGIG